PITDVAPAVAGVGNSVYFFAKTRDGRIMYDWAELGKGGHGWREMEGTGRTNAAPAAGAVREHVFVAIKGLDGYVYINQADQGRPFNDQWSQSCLNALVDPAVAVEGKWVYFFAKTLDGRIVYDWAVLGQGGHGWREMEGTGRSNAAPAAGAVRDHVFVAIKGLDGHVYVNQADQGRPFNDQWF